MKQQKLILFTNNDFSKSTNIEQKGSDDFMKNICKRKDGRYMGKKTINGTTFYAYAKTQTECIKLLQKKIKENKNTNKQSSVPNTLYKFALYWYENYKAKNVCEKSARNYYNYIQSDFKELNYDFKSLDLNLLQTFINNIPATRKREYCLMILKQVLKKAYEFELIKKNYGEFLVKGKIARKKIEWYNLEEQKLILENLKNEDEELLTIVYTLLLTGCRPSELKTISKEKVKENLVYINGTKTKNAKRWIKISNFLQKLLINSNIEKYFKLNTETIGRYFSTFLNKLNIKGTLYMLRHTFATNLFYLGVSDKERQSYMGHASSVITNDVYTDFDPTIKKNDILNLYINLLPKF